MKMNQTTPFFTMPKVYMMIVLCALLSLTGCVSGSSHASDLGSSRDRAMTVGLVQKELRKGQSQADVASALGSPNLVTKDINDNETWVYDKIATEASYSNSSANLGAGGLGAGAVASTLLLGGVNGSYDRNAGASSSTQRTLTVIIKFNKSSLVEAFSYHSSKF